MKLLNKYTGKRETNYIPESDVEELQVSELFDSSQLRLDSLQLPSISEPELMRHFIKLSDMNYHVDKGMYPLGSCTMKYSPKVSEDLASLPGFMNLHPETPETAIQGAIKLMFELGEYLKELSGMDAITLQPKAGAHGELTGLLIARAYFNLIGKDKKIVLIPDTAHGTNPASSARAGFKVREVKSSEDGILEPDHLKEVMSEDVALLMITNPNTLGIFESHIGELARILHSYGALLYMDGANLNALMGKAKMSDFGVDIMHFNLHKTFSTPHGGGGPGSGPVAVRGYLKEFLPVPIIDFDNEKYYFNWDIKHSIGKVSGFYGAFSVMIKAYAYIRMLGAIGLREVSEQAVINSNYLLTKLKEDYNLPYGKNCMHEFVLSGSNFKEFGIRALDIAKRLLDYGFHAPTIYFPLIVHEALMVEPTETESKESLDGFINAMKGIAREAKENPDKLKKAPQTTPVGRLDEVKANKELNVRWRRGLPE
ncbi:MAG: aminomethyl-transferring glycine dehydrogenase subunit GcvPB [candidate division WOR-3 bacterium]|nr:aminomethyl-transferring glycine dehydrogenase subunit GcvPB [candidate division WOR-3 bacterium]